MLDNQRGTGGKNNLDLLIQRCLAGYLQEAAKEWCSNPDTAPGLRAWFGTPDAVECSDAQFKYAANISSIGDDITFDAAVDCSLSLSKRTDTGEKRSAIKQWLTISCKVSYVRGDLAFASLSARQGRPVLNKHRENPVDGNLVPIISRENLDAEAARFLREYCPGALIAPQPVPIKKILKEQMGLTLIEGGATKSAAEPADGQVFGKIYFSPTPIEFQCPETKQKKPVQRGGARSL